MSVVNTVIYTELTIINTHLIERPVSNMTNKKEAAYNC